MASGDKIHLASKEFVAATYAKLNGDVNESFKVASGTADEDALNKGQLLDEVKAIDGVDSGIDADLLDGKQGSDYQLTTNMIDEDDMGSDDDTKYPTQQSVKAYVDNKVGDQVKLDTDETSIVKSSDDSFIKNQCTAWVNFDGTDGTIRDSYNVDSVTRNDTGDYSVSTSLDNVNGSATGSVPGGNNVATTDITAVDNIDVKTTDADTSDSFDPATVYLIVFGGK